MNDEIVTCHAGHLASREAVENVGGCPYCLLTPSERIASWQARLKNTKDG